MGLRIIYGANHCGFDNSLAIANVVRPTIQLAKMTRRFAKKCSEHPKFAHWFQPVPKDVMNTRSKKKKCVEVSARTERYHNSPIPYLTRILNEDSA